MSPASREHKRLTFSRLRVSLLFECLAELDPGMEHCWKMYAGCLQNALPGCSASAWASPHRPDAEPSLCLEYAVKCLASPLRVLLHEATWGQREAAVTELIEKCSEVNLQLLIQGEGSDNGNEMKLRCAAAAATVVLDTVACYMHHPET